MRLTAPGIQPNADLETQQRQQYDDDVARVGNGLGQQLVPEGTPTSETQKADNAFWLGAGVHGGFAMSASRTRVDGASGALVKRPATFASTAIVTGLDFTAGVTLGAQSVTTFNGCTFRGDSVAALVTCAAGAKATFVGCQFHGSPTQVVDNPGAIGNITVVGCANLTGAGLGNVTAVGSV